MNNRATSTQPQTTTLSQGDISPREGETKTPEATVLFPSPRGGVGEGVALPRGYAGPTPLEIHITNGVIDSVVALPNQETPEFFQMVKDEILPLYKGKTVEEAYNMQVDAVSGATFSSRAVIETAKIELSKAASASPFPSERRGVLPLSSLRSGASGTGELEGAAVLLVILMAAILPLFIKNRTYRMVQQVLNVAVLGFYAGTFVNYTALVGLASSALDRQLEITNYIPLLLLVVVAFVYPLFGKKNHYCAWCCPMGAAQDLAFKIKIGSKRHKLVISQKGMRRMKLLRMSLWAVLMLLSLLGVWTSWMNYEIFTAFLWQSASWVMIAFLCVTLLISIFMPRPYCRLLCPTGTLIRM